MRLHKLIIFLLLIQFFVAFPFSDSVKAQGIDLNSISKIPRYQSLPEEKFVEMTREIEEKPPGDKYLAFRMRVPKDWVRVGGDAGESRKNESSDDGESLDESDHQSSQPLARRVMGRVVQFFGPATLETPSRFEVTAMALDYDISAKNWFIHHIISNSYTLQSVEEISDRRIEGLYVVVDRGESFIVRTVAEINGLRMILASYYLPESKWEKEKAIQEKVIGSFQFLNPEKIKISPTSTYAFLDLLRVDYPSTWRLVAPDIKSVDEMAIKIVNALKADIVQGEIEINVISTEIDTTLADEVKYLRDSLKDRGFSVGKLIESPTGYHFGDHVLFNRIEVYELKEEKNRLQSYEYWLAVMAEDRYYYIVTLLTPSRQSEFYTWARNVESFGVVTESIRP